MLDFIKKMLGIDDLTAGAQQTFDVLANKTPVAGQSWVLKSVAGDPFDPKPGTPVAKILEVRDGWVRYYMNKVFDDERKPIPDFVRIYQYLKD